MDICTRNMSAWFFLMLICYCYTQDVKNSNQQYNYKEDSGTHYRIKFTTQRSMTESYISDILFIFYGKLLRI